MSDEKQVPDSVELSDELEVAERFTALLVEVERLQANVESITALNAASVMRENTLAAEYDELQAENAALREIVEAVAACELREIEGRWRISGGLARVGLFDPMDRVNVLEVRDKARALLDTH